MRSVPMLLAATSLALVAAFPVRSQQTVVSPQSAATTEGASANVFPWSNSVVRRYLQIHSDLKATPLIVRQLAWRRDGLSTFSATTLRTVDCELYMGHSLDYDACSYVMSANWTMTSKTLVVPRQVVNLGPCTLPGNPAPFEIAIPLTTPFLYIPVWSLAWEAVVYSNTVGAGVWPALDAHVSSTTFGNTPVSTGVGCTATGRTSPMSLVISHSDCGGLYSFGAYVQNAPANQQVYLALGTANPILSVPGLCGLVLTNLALVIPAGPADSNGYLGNVDEMIQYAAPSMILMAPNTIGGTTLFLQAHALDPQSSQAVPFVNSDGKSMTVPFPNTTVVSKATRLFNNANGTNATQAIYFNTSSPSYAIVTQFTY